MLRRWLVAVVSSVALLAGVLIGSAPAQAADGVYCDNASGVCFITISSIPGDPAPNTDSNGWTPGAPTCYYENSQSGLLQMGWRSEERRVGNACVSPCRSRWSRYT